MKLCFMCDLHLPFDKNALQYDVLNWALEDIRKKKPECVVCAGDLTCDGNIDAYNCFLDKMKSKDIRFIYIPGSSDLGCSESCSKIKKMASVCKNNVNDILIFAVNDCDGTVSDEQLLILEEAEDNSIVFMHHPIDSLVGDSPDKMIKWRKNHKNTMLFYGHKHKFETEDNSISLPAMDPDKAIGENPCVLYYDTDTREIRKSYYFSPVPKDLYRYFGVSCYKLVDDVRFAVKNKLKNLELRPGCLDMDEDKLLHYIEIWRKNGGENLSIHLPGISYSEGEVIPDKRFDEYIHLANHVRADRFTQHMPRVSVKTATEEANALDEICGYLADKLNTIEHNITIGIENMHMTANETAYNNSRRYGYIPWECIEFIKILGSKCKHNVGINFDIGNTINNIPYSRTYQISTWLSLVGKYIVGYHIHQVTLKDGLFENHMPVTDIYGYLINYSSFFKYWAEERINKAPVIFEMRADGAYSTTLQTFNIYKQKYVFDIHSHTYYSDCGRDNPHDLVNTAIKNGISMLGISDHNYGIGRRKPEYIKEIRALAGEYKDRIKILCGMEIATLPHLYDLSDSAETETDA